MLSFESEFKINNQWKRGELIDIDIENNIYIIKILSKDKDKEDYLIKYKNKNLVCDKNFINWCNDFPLKDQLQENNLPSYELNEQVEFYNEEGWQNGEVKSKKGNFYTISFIPKKKVLNYKIVYINSLRKTKKFNDIITLNIDKCKYFSIDIFKDLKNPSKCIKQLLKEINKIFNNDELKFAFYSNYKIYLFSYKLDDDLFNNIIKLTYEHFKEIDNYSDDEYFNSLCDNLEDLNNEKEKANFKQDKNNFKFKKDIVVDKSIFEIQKSKIKNLSIKTEVRPTRNSNDLNICVKAKDEEVLKIALNILNMKQIYINVPLKENDAFFTDVSLKAKNLNYYTKLYRLEAVSFYKSDDENYTTIKAYGKKDNINHFQLTIKGLFQLEDLQKEKLEIIQNLKNDIIN